MNTSMIRIGGFIAASVAVGSLWCVAAAGQVPENPTRDDAVVIIDGTVREVFRSPRQDRLDYLVEIEVKRIQADRVPRIPPRVAVPAPGDIVYIHTSQRGAGVQGRGFSGQNPATGDTRRSYRPNALRFVLTSHRPREAAGRVLEAIRSKPRRTCSRRRMPQTHQPPNQARCRSRQRRRRPRCRPAANRLWLARVYGREHECQRPVVLRLERRARRSRAAIGLEPGDIVIGANDAALGGLEQLARLAEQGLKNLLVLDVNTGKAARVAVDMNGSKGSQTNNGLPPRADNTPDVASPPAANRNPTPSGTSKSLGISAEPVMVGRRTGMKVIRVEPASPAQKAGIEIGDVIVAANGVAVTGVEVLSAVLKKSGPSLTLTVPRHTHRSRPARRSQNRRPGEQYTDAGPRRYARRDRKRPQVWCGHRAGFLRRQPRGQSDRGRTEQPRSSRGHRAWRYHHRGQRHTGLASQDAGRAGAQKPARAQITGRRSATNKKTSVDVNLDGR